MKEQLSEQRRCKACKQPVPEKRDPFWWYGGQVDVAVVREIVRLKRSGKL